MPELENQANRNGAGGAANERMKRLVKAVSGVLVPLSFLLLLCVALSLTAPNFATNNNIKIIAVQAAVVAILACGQTAVIISGNIDLSVGAIMAFAGVAAAQAMTQGHVGVWAGVFIACAAGLGAGLLNGLITAYGKIPSFIVTLGLMGIARGAAGYISQSVNIGGLPQGFGVFGSGELFGSAVRDGIPYAVLIMIGAALVTHIGLSKTTWGRGQYALGGNREAARLSGLNIRASVVSVFALSGLLAGIAAIVNVSRATVASKDAGLGYELDAVAAAVVGGTSLFGGQGGIPGTIIGAFLIYTIRNGCDLKNYDPNIQQMIIGGVVILAVLYDRYGPGKRAVHDK